jgi:hypothetical protein
MNIFIHGLNNNHVYTCIQPMADMQITIDKKKYILADNVIQQCPVWCKGIRSGREFVTKMEIPANKWTYAKNVDDVWVVADGKSKRHDKAIVRRKYLMECQPYVDEIKGVNVRDANGIEIAPPIICLEEEEMFDDEQGNALEIETRGVRECNGVYFRVNDVSDAFRIDSLRSVIINKNTHYVEHVDYKYFMRTTRGIAKKELYLTYRGFRRMIEVGRTNYSATMCKKMHDWLVQFDPNPDTDYGINMSDEKSNSLKGYLYCITSNVVNCVKMGCWRGSLDGLRARYITYYGSDLTMHCVETNNARQLESLCHREFIGYRVANELFEKEHLDKYIAFAKSHSHIQ